MKTNKNNMSKKKIISIYMVYVKDDESINYVGYTSLDADKMLKKSYKRFQSIMKKWKAGLCKKGWKKGVWTTLFTVYNSGITCSRLLAKVNTENDNYVEILRKYQDKYSSVNKRKARVVSVKECSRKRKEYYEKTKELVKEKGKRHYQKNKKKIIEKAKKRYKNNKDEINKKRRKMYSSNKVKCECGKSLSEKSMKYHLNSKLHIKKMELKRISAKNLELIIIEDEKKERIRAKRIKAEKMKRKREKERDEKFFSCLLSLDGLDLSRIEADSDSSDDDLFK